jgi:hypothetical protein
LVRLNVVGAARFVVNPRGEIRGEGNTGPVPIHATVDNIVVVIEAIEHLRMVMEDSS